MRAADFTVADAARTLNMHLDARFAGIPVHGITADSRQVRKGFIFVAVNGARAHGGDFIPDALARGAALIIGADHGETPAAGACRIAHPNPRLALSKLAAMLFPRQPDYMAAVTGTDGKTS